MDEQPKKKVRVIVPPAGATYVPRELVKHLLPRSFEVVAASERRHAGGNQGAGTGTGTERRDNGVPKSGSTTRGARRLGIAHQKTYAWRGNMQTATAPYVEKFAGFWICALAFLVDLVLGYFIQFGVGFVIGLLWGDFGTNWIFDHYATLTVGFWLVYFPITESAAGGTPGKRLCGLAVSDSMGNQLGFWRSLARNASKFVLSAPFLGYGFLLAIGDKDGRTLHDRIAKTRVIVLESLF